MAAGAWSVWITALFIGALFAFADAAACHFDRRFHRSHGGFSLAGNQTFAAIPHEFKIQRHVHGHAIGLTHHLVFSTVAAHFFVSDFAFLDVHVSHESVGLGHVLFADAIGAGVVLLWHGKGCFNSHTRLIFPLAGLNVGRFGLGGRDQGENQPGAKNSVSHGQVPARLVVG